jgi:hypothetical protein
MTRQAAGVLCMAPRFWVSSLWVELTRLHGADAKVWLSLAKPGL